MDDRGALSWFLGMQVKQSSGRITNNQSHGIDDCLERLGLAECKPADITAQLSKMDCPEAGSAQAVSMKV